MAKLWREIPQFHSRPKRFYEKRQGDVEAKALAELEPPRVKETTFTTTPKGLLSLKMAANHRQRLSHLIQCLAISETQKKQLAIQIDTVTRQKEDLDMKLSSAIKDKQEVLEKQRSNLEHRL